MASVDKFRAMSNGHDAFNVSCSKCGNIANIQAPQYAPEYKSPYKRALEIASTHERNCEG